jgi:hypothetical protein
MQQGRVFQKQRSRSGTALATANRFSIDTRQKSHKEALPRARQNQQSVKVANQCDSNDAPESGLPPELIAVG